MAKADLTAQRVRELLDYNPDTGDLIWRETRGAGFNSNGICRSAGDIAGCIAESSNVRRRVVSIGGGRQYAHRLAWLHYYGEWPKHFIDHINGDSLDNRIANLRDVPPRTNSQNLRSPTRANTSGYLGVTRHKKTRWRTVIRLPDGTRKYSYHDTAEAASEAYIADKRLLHGGNTL